MRKRTLIIIDQSLKDLAGHHFEYDRSLSEAAISDGYDVVVLANKSVSRHICEDLQSFPVFELNAWDQHPLLKTVTGANYLLSNYRFYRDLLKAMKRSEINQNSIIMAHMITPRQLLAWAGWLCRCSSNERLPIVLLLRYETELFDNPLGLVSFKLLEWAHKHCRFTLTTDSQRLATKYSFFCKIPVSVLPIPHTELFSGQVCKSFDMERKVKICCPGNARRDKGIVEVLEALDILNKNGSGSTLEISVQLNSSDRSLDEVMSCYKSKNIPNLKFLDAELDSIRYVNSIIDSDLVLLPYWRSIYADRTSGVFTEALAAGKPVIVTANTWMADQLQSFGAGLTVDDRNSVKLAETIKIAVSKANELSQSAAFNRNYWNQIHNGKSLWLRIKDVILNDHQFGQ